MSENRGLWLFVSVFLTAAALFVLGLGIFDAGENTPSNQMVYVFCAIAVLNLVAYFGSRT